jgi:hypothetical protein
MYRLEGRPKVPKDDNKFASSITGNEFGASVAGTRSRKPPDAGAGKRNPFDTPAMKAYLQEIARKLVIRLDEDLSVAPPRSGENNGQAVTAWLARYNEHFLRILPEAIADAAGPASSEGERQDRLANTREVAEKVLPQVMPELRAFALRRTALRWGARKYPNFVEFGSPEFAADERIWTVPLEHIRTHKRVGQVVLDVEGNVREDRTTTSHQVRETLTIAA